MPEEPGGFLSKEEDRREFLKDAARVGLSVFAALNLAGAGATIIGKEYSESMEGEGDFNIPKDIKAAAKLEERKGHLIDNPIARFNMGLEGLNPDWQPKGERVEAKPTPESLKKELQNIERFPDPVTGQNFGVLRLNWEKFGPDSRVMVFIPSYGNTIEMSTNNYRLEELTKYLEVPVLAIDHPNSGGSDKWTDEQRDILAREKSYRAIAEAQLRMMKAQGIKEIDLVGQSMGGWAIAEIARQAAHHGIKVKNLVVIEAPGVEDFTSKEMQDNLLSEFKYLGLAQSRPYDPRMREAGGQHKSAFERAMGHAQFYMATKFKRDPGGLYSDSMIGESLPTILEESLRLNPDLHLTVVNGTTSKVSPRESNSRMVKKLRDAGFQDRVRHIMLPGEGHFAMESSKRFAPTTTMAVNQ